MQSANYTSKNFATDFKSIQKRVDSIDPLKYGRSRNFIDGSVTYLSPYISRGVISTKQVFELVTKRGFDSDQIEKFIQELAWRDYWQLVWVEKGDAINEDIKNKQSPVDNSEIPIALLNAQTGLKAIDIGLKNFYDTGYMHNHVRMYVASISCNIARSHWKYPAQWMYYHLLDGDWASNALSWQWVAGANSNKKYYANQENINKYCYTNQKDTFLDVPYSDFEGLDIPKELKKTLKPDLTTQLPKQQELIIDNRLPTLVYNYYNLDPQWKKETEANRILLLEPSHFEVYPISQKSLYFAIELSKNISGIQVFIGEFNSLISTYKLKNVFYKEHPLSRHYVGIEELRDWIFDVKGYYPSFFKFWKECKKQLTY